MVAKIWTVCEKFGVSIGFHSGSGKSAENYQVVGEIPKPRQLLYLLEVEQPSSAIVFCNTRNETEMIAKYLTQSGFIAEPLMGSFRQRDRERVMGRIKSGELRYMVATTTCGPQPGMNPTKIAISGTSGAHTRNSSARSIPV